MNKYFKNLFMLLVAIVATTAFAACSSDDKDDFGTNVEFRVIPETVTFTNAGGEKTVSVQSNGTVSAVSSATGWLTVTVGTQSQKLKVTALTVAASANTGNDDRTATITVTADSQTKVINITQTSTDGLIISSEKTVHVPADGGNVEVALRANGDYTVTPSASWITVTKTRASMADCKCVLSVAANGSVARTATVAFKLGTISETVTINQEGAPTPEVNAGAKAIAKQMYPGWNLGNTFEATGNGLNAETAWQNTKTTQAIIDYVKSLGFKSVRIPCSWNIHSTNGTIDTAWMARVREVVDYCISDGLYVLLNDHWDSGWIEVDGFSDLSESNVSSKASTLKNIWTQIATEFRDYGDHLLFAGLNEPNCDSQAKTDVLIRYEQAFIDAVRATGGNNALRTLVVQGPSTDIEKTNSYYDVAKLTDSASDALMVEVHYYTPWNFCGMEQDESWGKMFFYWGSDNHLSGSAYNANYGEEADLRKLFQSMKAKFVGKGVPVIIGEYGCQWRDLSAQSGASQEKHDASVKLFHQTVCQQAVNMGMVPMVWDINAANQRGTKGIMTVLNRSDLSIFCTPAMDGITAGVAAATWGGQQ